MRSTRTGSRSITRHGRSNQPKRRSRATQWRRRRGSVCRRWRPCCTLPSGRIWSAGRPTKSVRHAGMPLTLLCIATYHKGDEFLRECRRQGCRVLLLTDETLRDADWPRDAIDAFYYVRHDMPEADVRKGAAYLARTERLDRIVALDDFDVETAAMLREYLHIPGMGETTGRAFRDKLAMRARARRKYPLSRLRPRGQSSDHRGVDVASCVAVGPQAAIAGGSDR